MWSLSPFAEGSRIGDFARHRLSRGGSSSHRFYSAYFCAVQYIEAPLTPDVYICTLIGMAALAVAIIGAPLAMSFLALETTGDFPLGLVMLAVASIVSIIVRRTFGYSFATWRLHVRGGSIRSAQDVGWMRDLTVARLMQTDVPKAHFDMTLSDFVEAFPVQSSEVQPLASLRNRRINFCCPE
jgi:chloride channel protein, CIC family